MKKKKEINPRYDNILNAIEKHSKNAFEDIENIIETHDNWLDRIPWSSRAIVTNLTCNPVAFKIGTFEMQHAVINLRQRLQSNLTKCRGPRREANIMAEVMPIETYHNYPTKGKGPDIKKYFGYF